MLQEFLVLSPNEEFHLLASKEAEDRKTRLLQTRQREKEIATQRRHRFKARYDQTLFDQVTLLAVMACLN